MSLVNPAISKYLRADEELKSLLNQTKVPKINPVIPHKNDDYPYVTFDTSIFQAGRFVHTYRCEVNILTKGVKDGLSLSEKITNRVLDLLHFKENNQKVVIDDVTIHHSKHVGGGRDFNDSTEVYQQLLVFQIKTN